MRGPASPCSPRSSSASSSSPSSATSSRSCSRGSSTASSSASGSNPVSDLLAGLIAYLPKVFAAVLILVIAAAVAKVVTELLQATVGAVSGGEWIARGAGIAILVVGVFAALNQLEIAPEIVNGLFYAILAIIVGSAIVAVGGGGIQTMRQYWERASLSAEQKGREIKRNADPDAARARVEQAKQQ